MNPIHVLAPIMKGERGRRFYLQLIITMMCIGILPPLVMNVAAYYQLTDSIERESSENHMNYLKQTITSIEIIFQQIMNSSQQLVLSSTVREFERFPGGAYYETLQGTFQANDLKPHYNYVVSKQIALDQLRKFKLSNSYISSAYLYESGSGYIHAIDENNRQLSMSEEQFYDMGWLELLDQNQVSPVFKATRMSATDQDGVHKAVMTILMRTGIHNNAVIINLDASEVYDQIFDKVSTGAELYLADEQGKIALYRDHNLIQTHLRELYKGFDPETNVSGYYVSDDASTMNMVSYAKSSMLNWWLVHIVPMDQLLQSKRYLQQIITIYSFLLILLVASLSVLSSQKLYRRFSSALQERDYFKKRMEESLPYYRERFELSLLKPHRYTQDEIEQKAQELQATVPLGESMVWLLAKEQNQVTGRPINEDLDHLRLREAITVCPALKKLEWVLMETSNLQLVIVVTAEKREISTLITTAKQLQEDVKDKTGLALSVGMSRPCASAMQLPQAFEEAEEALKYRIVMGRESLIYYGDIVSHKRIPFTYPTAKANLLCTSIKLGDSDKAVDLFKDWMEAVEQQTHSVHYEQVMPIYMRLLNEMIGSANDVIRESTWLDPLTPYEALLARKTSAQISEWFASFIRLTADHIQKEHIDTGNKHVEGAKEIIHRDYANDITLQSASDELKLSPNYLSRLFKQTTGQSFVDYLTELRMEKAKQLLLEENYKVNQICSMVGYSSSYYFIKVFREQTGMTPGEFRKIGQK